MVAGLALAAVMLPAVAGCAFSGPDMADNAVPVTALAPEDFAKPRRTIPTLSLDVLAKAQAQPFRLQTGDALRVTVHGTEGPLAERGVAVRVNPTGVVVLPMVGGVRVGGMTLASAEQAIGKPYLDAGIIKRPQVFVELINSEGNWVSVTGEVSRPGLYELPRQTSSVLAALAKAGGLTDRASSIIEVARCQGGPTTRLNLLEPGTIQGKPLWVGNGDHIRVRPWPKEWVYITGLVASTGPLVLPRDRDVDLLSAIGMAGGIDPTIRPTKVLVVRHQNNGGERSLKKILINLVEATGDSKQNLILQDGDYVAVIHDGDSYMRAALHNIVVIRGGASATLSPGGFN